MKVRSLVSKIAMALGVLGAGSLFTACGGGHHSAPHPVIIVNGGYWGYYSGLEFCYWANNYCETNLAYGITDGGLYYDGVYYTNGPSSSGTSSGGTYSGGTTSGGTTSGGTTSGGTYSGGTSGGTYSGGTYSGGTYSGGTYSGGYASTGSAGGCTSGCTSSGTAFAQQTTDVNLQRGLAQNAQLDAMAQMNATQFQMSFEAARQLTQLANKMQILQQNGQLSDDDRAALARSALAVAHVEEGEVSDAVAKASQGDKAALDTVMTKAATNLGMPSSAMLRDQILPSLGIVIPQ